jgi:hypothetical protein
MASYSVATAKSATLTGTTADTVTLTQRWPFVEVMNRGANNITFVVDPNAAAPTALQDNGYVVAPGQTLTVPVNLFNASGQTVIQLVANGDAYTVTGVAR